MQPDISYPQQALDHFYHPSRLVTFTQHAYATPGSGVGPQVGKQALNYRHHGWWPSVSIDVIFSVGITTR